MGEAVTFQRARKPEEQQIRREAILAAARELFDAEGPQGAGLNAIAAKAGFTKSNVYRYFESREEVLLSLFLAELTEVTAAFEARTALLADGDIPGIANALTRCFVDRPRFGILLSMIVAVLEQNVSEAKIIELKRSIIAANARVGGAIHHRLRGSKLEDCLWVAGTTATLVAGMWPGFHSSKAAQQVLTLPEFAPMRPAPERDLPRTVEALLRSIV